MKYFSVTLLCLYPLAARFEEVFLIKSLRQKKIKNNNNIAFITYQIRVHVEFQLKAAYIHYSIVEACERLHLLQAVKKQRTKL